MRSPLRVANVLIDRPGDSHQRERASECVSLPHASVAATSCRKCPRNGMIAQIAACTMILPDGHDVI